MHNKPKSGARQAPEQMLKESEEAPRLKISAGSESAAEGESAEENDSGEAGARAENTKSMNGAIDEKEQAAQPLADSSGASQASSPIETTEADRQKSGPPSLPIQPEAPRTATPAEKRVFLMAVMVLAVCLALLACYLRISKGLQADEQVSRWSSTVFPEQEEEDPMDDEGFLSRPIRYRHELIKADKLLAANKRYKAAFIYEHILSRGFDNKLTDADQAFLYSRVGDCYAPLHGETPVASWAQHVASIYEKSLQFHARSNAPIRSAARTVENLAYCQSFFDLSKAANTESALVKALEADEKADDSDLLSAYVGVGGYLQRLRRESSAIDYYRKALTLAHKLGTDEALQMVLPAYEVLFFEAMRTQKYQEALVLVDEEILHTPKDTVSLAFHNKVWALQRLGRNAEADAVQKQIDDSLRADR